MPLFAIHCIDKPAATALRAANRAAHLDYVRGFGPKVIVGGPLLSEAGEPIGSLLILDLADRRAATRFAADDPYAHAGLFASVAVTSWRQVFPEAA